MRNIFQFYKFSNQEIEFMNSLVLCCLSFLLKCERVKKKRGSLMGSLRLAHDLSIDEVDQKILSARFVLLVV